MTKDKATQMLLHELERAERKFPMFPTDPIHAAAVVAEEAGELVQASIDATYNTRPDDAELFDNMMVEAIQTGAMALRFLINFGNYSIRPDQK